jgi:hypothetical protein
MSATTDPDLFSFALNAGDSVYLALDMDPNRDPTNTNWNGRLGLGVFNNFFLVANDSSTTKPHAEAFFFTVQDAGTYYAYVDSTSATGLGANARYHLSVRVIPKLVQTDCTIIDSSNVPVAIGPDPGTATSSISVPGTVTSSINDIKVLLNITHANMPDLDVTLTSPAATATPLFTDVGSSTQVDMNVWLDDNAALPIGAFTVVSVWSTSPSSRGGCPRTTGRRRAAPDVSIADDPLPTALAMGELVRPAAGSLRHPAHQDGGLEPGVCGTSSDHRPARRRGVLLLHGFNIGLNDLVTTIWSTISQPLDRVSYPRSRQRAPSGRGSGGGQRHRYQHGDLTRGTERAETRHQTPASATVTVPTHCPAGYQDVTWAYSDFAGAFPPAGWSVTNTSVNCTAPGVPDWTNTDPGLRGNLTGGVGPFAIADSDRCGSGSTLDTILTTPLFDMTALTDPRVYYFTDYNDIATGGDQGVLDVSTDSGATWSPS